MLSGTVRSRVPGGGFAQRAFTLHAGGRDAVRAEFSGPGFERVYVTDGELARLSQDGRRKGLPLRGSANKLYPFNPLSGLFRALTESDLQLEGLKSEAGALVVEFLYLDRQPRVPRSRSMARRYQVRLDPETLLVSSLTLFTSHSLPLVPDEPRDVYEYSDYRQVEGMQVPFRIRSLTPSGFLLSEFLLDGAEPSNSDPDLELP